MRRRGFYLNILLVAWLLSFLPGVVRAESSGRLLVFTSEYCPYCREFMQTVAPVYPKTGIGRRFPMQAVDNFSPPAELESLSWEIRFFPTFLVVDAQGKQWGRFRGYRGEEFFWGELEAIVARMPPGDP